MFRIVTLPSDDAEFSADVRAALAEADEGAESSQALIAVLEQLLPRYPDMEISQQNGLASYQADPDTLYVYRHGGTSHTGPEADSNPIE